MCFQVAPLQRDHVSRDGLPTYFCADSCCKRFAGKREHEIEGYFQEIVTSEGLGYVELPDGLIKQERKSNFEVCCP